MKYYFLTLFVLLLSNCKSQEITFSNEEPSKNDLITIATTIGNEKNLITFTEHFNNDIVSVSTDNEIAYRGSISTDLSMGAARGVMFDRSCKLISVTINDKELQIENFPEYRFIYIYKEENIYKIEYQKKPIIFL